MARPETHTRMQADNRDDSPLASLSRTLDSLEARLARLPAVRPLRPGDPLAAHVGAITVNRPRALAEAVSEIVMRRKALEEMAVDHGEPDESPDRRPLRAAMPAARPRPMPDPLARSLEDLASQADLLQRQDGSVRLMTDIHGELQRLREEMRNAGRGTFERGFQEMRQSFEDLRRMIEERESADVIGAELQLVAASLAQLTEAGADRPTLNAMRSELEELRHLYLLGAREASVQAVGDRWQSFEKRYAVQAEEDLAAKEELKSELQRLRESLRSLAREDQMQAVERRWDAFEERYRDQPDQTSMSQAIRDELSGMRAKLEALSDAAEPLGRVEARWSELENRLQKQMADSVRGLSDRMGEIETRIADLPGSADISVIEERIRTLATGIDALSRHRDDSDAQNFQMIEERLDEISRAIVATAASGGAFDMGPIERIEARIAALTSRVDQLGNDGKVEDLSARIADLAGRVEALTAVPADPEMADRIEALTARFDVAFAEFETPRFDTREIEQRIAGLGERFETMLSQMDAPRIETAAIEERLSRLAAHLETKAVEPQVDEALVRSLESQILRLNESLLRVGAQHEDFEKDFDRRLGLIEQRLEDQRDALILAAREAAEETAKRMQALGDERQARHVGQLSESLRALETLSRDKDGRSGEVFEAVHSTLQKIVDRLDLIESEIGAPARAREAQAPAAGPRPLPETAPATAAPFAAPEPGAQPFPLADRARDAVSGARMRDESVPPPIEPADMIDRSEMNRPLEPGSGMPDIGALLERVRAAQLGRHDTNAKPGSESETRAAARAAAVAASDEAGRLRDAGAGGERGLKALIMRRRKAILTGVVAVIVALSALPVGQSFLTAPDKAAQEQAVAPLAAPQDPVSETAAMDPASEPASVPPQAAAEPVEAPAPAKASAPLEQPDLSPIEPLPNASEPAAAPVATGSAIDALKAKLPASALAMPSIPEGIGSQALADAATAGDPKAAFEIGLRLMEGRSGQAQPDKAFDWFAQGALKGFAPAQYSLGSLYEKGNGVERDTLAARDWYTLAAESGNVRAMHNLAVLYATGIDGRSQPEVAARWFEDAADHGMRDSQYNLGILYARGSGVRQDLVKSYKWFGVVAASGDADAAAKRDEIAKSMSAEQIKAAQGAVTGFSAAPRVETANSVETPAEWQDQKVQITSSVDMTKAIRNIQAILGKLGYDAGVPDGKLGGKTKIAIAKFQTDNAMAATGEIDGPLIRALLQKKGG